ncbi:MAG: glycosyltransferase [Planctomycetota bacterium]|nr:glycosyltransferase [Planctomycetota bacterium]
MGHCRVVHVVYLHPALVCSGTTERLLASLGAAREAGLRATVLSRPGSRTLALQQTGAELLHVELPEPAWREPFAAWRTRSVVRRLAPDLLHVTDDRLAGLAAALSASLRIPYLLEVARQVRKPTLRSHGLLRAILLPCPTFVERAVNRGRADRTLLRVLENGPSIERPWEPHDLDNERLPCIGALGYLDEDHGTQTLIDAAQLLRARGRHLRFVVLGEGPRDEALRRRVREKGVHDTFTIAAPAMTDLAGLMLELDLHASCTLEGGAGWLADRALGLGIPSIFSAVSSSLHQITDERNALLYEPGNAPELAERIAAVLDDPDGASEMGLRARTAALEARRTQAYRRALTELYEELRPAVV